MRIMLLTLVAFILFGAVFGGLLMMSEPRGYLLGLQPAILKTTPFTDFLLPGLLLLIVVGGVFLVGFFLLLVRHPHRYGWSLAAGTVLLSWLLVQYLLIPVSLWLDIFFFGLALGVILTSLHERGKSLI